MNEQSSVGKYIWRQVIPHSVMRALPELWIRCSGKGLAFTGHYSCVNKDTSPRGLVVFYYLNVFMFSKTSARGRVLFQKQICSNFCLEGKRWQAVWLSATDLKELNSKTGFTHYMTFCCCSVTKSCLTLWDPIDCSTPGSPVLHYHLLEFAQIYVHWVGGAIQSSHPPSPPSPPALSLSQHQGLFRWVSSLHQVAKVLEFQLQHQSFQWMFRTDFIYHWLVWSPCRPRDSSLLQHHSSKTSILQCSAFFKVQLSLPYITVEKL